MSAIGPHPAEKPSPRYCAHPDCRIDAFEEMVFMAAELQRADISRQAFECLHPDVQVVCRRTPRKGPIRAQLPERAEQGGQL